MTLGKPTRLFIASLLLAASPLALAAETPTLNTANTAWLLTSSVLVLFMTTRGSRCSTAGWCGRKTCCPS